MNFGLIGSITYDVISFESRRSFEGVGGVLYQAAVFCGMGEEVFMYANLGQELIPRVEKIIENWSILHRQGIIHVPGSGNQVQLFYPEKGERVETLRSVVPALNPTQIIEDLYKLGILVLVINSGYDIKLRDWRRIVEEADCPLWLDIHSLPLTGKLHTSREYQSLPEWREWANGVGFLQANKKEVASMLGYPEKWPSEAEIFLFGKEAFELGLKAVFITLGKEGVLVMTPEESEKVVSTEAGKVVDTTGCGDVFCGGTVAKLAEGKDPFEAASFGLHLATQAVSIRGIEETYILACHYGRRKIR